MKCILNSDICIRSFWLIPYCYFRYNDEKPYLLSKEEFNLLLLCDGKNDLKVNNLLRDLIFKKRVCHPVIDENKKLNKWQKFRYCNNRCMPKMNIAITGRCNYNCLHCFNAKDNNPLNAQYDFIDLVKLFDECQKCGVQAFTITGGEPMVHPRFLDIIKEIYKRHMWVFELNTNGYFITQKILDEFKKIKCNPLIKISFDGLGFHDWMRNSKGAEKRTLEAIKLCVKNGFKVKIQYNINKHNISSVKKTLKLLDSIGVVSTRLIPTTDGPRWVKNANGESFNVKEIYEASIQIVKDIIEMNLKMDIDIWLLIHFFNNKFVSFSALSGAYSNRYDENIPFCKGVRSMIAVAADGNVYPCLQMSGIFADLGIPPLGNVKANKLQKLLQNSEYMKFICQNIKDKYKFNKDCQKCRYFIYCNGGCCSIQGLIKYHSVLAKNDLTCYFYKNNYFEKYTEILKKSHYKIVEFAKPFKS